MQECADILYALNEGDHLQGRYVFYVVSKRLGHGSSSAAAAAAGGLSGSTSGDSGSDQHSLSGLFGRVVDVCRSEFPLIATVFPPSLAPKVYITFQHLCASRRFTTCVFTYLQRSL
jgi:hypothetical protein